MPQLVGTYTHTHIYLYIERYLILLLINILNLSWKSSLAIIKMSAICTKIRKQTEETANYARMLDGT